MDEQQILEEEEKLFLELQTEVEERKKENIRIKNESETLKVENKALRDQVNYLRACVADAYGLPQRNASRQ
eukprot:CAMPEP_0174261396 /NCGR_PEP_ID=MMETSP0439-20130205/11405_1 /TAXON_ID=0 /ORGANISM="Stereomyxa ramosa, Strain Chinc5" /LENGTH=70 /DNA_ID=CAMNT_0015345863 /DNA_START=89 /DNA_END=301 /DNA_ORIENTATION=+